MTLSEVNKKLNKINEPIKIMNIEFLDYDNAELLVTRFAGTMELALIIGNSEKKEVYVICNINPQYIPGFKTDTESLDIIINNLKRIDMYTLLKDKNIVKESYDLMELESYKVTISELTEEFINKLEQALGKVYKKRLSL
ncbi:MAG: hypothetical protein ACOCRX_04920 [Candidatus Woesearchaeota archaeon]